MISVEERVAALRQEMARHGVDAYLVPTADAHQNEYVPECWQRRAWVSGFTGSAGEALVTIERAGLWTDSRYFLQAEEELDPAVYQLFRMREPDVPAPEQWLADTLSRGSRLGFDPRTLSTERRERWADVLAPHGIELVDVEPNLVDVVRRDGTDAPTAPAVPLATAFTGVSIGDKIARVRTELTKVGAEALVETTLDAIAWLLNVRGSDVDFNPVVVSYLAILPQRVVWFVDDVKLDAAVRAHLADAVEVRPYAAFGEQLDELAARGTRTWIDPKLTSAWVARRLQGAPLVRRASPIHRLKAVKNEVELSGLRRALERDGVAMVRFLRWLGEAVPAGHVTEASAAARLAAIRAEGEHFRGLSFETISGYAGHGAIVHYRVTDGSDVPLEPAGLYLLDSGAQYLDGTTDITRTIALGPTTAEQRDRFTRVLRGHIDLARLRFPKGATGRQIELAARLPLWEAGLDYGHGTGHGVGAYLNVHEGPFSISQGPSEVALEPGMVSSNEPGYYEAGAYGIRIENLQVVVDPDAGRPPEELSPARHFYGFETLTLCPIDLDLVDAAALGDAQIAWLDAYHARVRETLTPGLADAADRDWLARATRPVGT